ncbi:hypothetical protein [Aminobacter ciceronei]|uniref:Uncharacterized protein n=1 Tax=Aminobacter ciceronei TaxID=150723 RepID=A0ABR6CHH5_9HYPH|nr:hypothetical protein [Aminobacter ciceronei]MBA8910692.1 hypothetical protein [Aminobacter ciceronei]MBA9024470.1 hypothetical protein [Aminobacter ciceronei]
MTQLTLAPLSPAVAPALILLGRDDAGKAHASWFDGEDAAPAKDAARLMGMAALPVEDDELRDLAVRLPKGKLFTSGRAFVPFVKGETFERLLNHLPEPLKARPVMIPRPAKATEKGTGDNASSDAAKPMPERPTATRPEDWSKIAVGSLVLAREGKDDGFFEARVVEVIGEGVYRLSWRDWLDYPPFTRKAEQIALLHPKASA